MLSERHVDKQAADAARIARRMLDYGEPRPVGANGRRATASNRPSTAELPAAARATLRLALSAWRTIAVARLVLLLSPSSRASRSADGAPGSRPAGFENSGEPGRLF
jgi:hypothetical protein